MRHLEVLAFILICGGLPVVGPFVLALQFGVRPVWLAVLAPFCVAVILSSVWLNRRRSR